MKNLKLCISVILMLVLTISSVFAVVQLPGNIGSLSNVSNQNDLVTNLVLKVNGIVIAKAGHIVRVERGQDLPVELFFKGSSVCGSGTDNPCYDVRARVYIGGYEYGDVQALSQPFEVEKNVDDSKLLILKIPNDIPASGQYTLNVELYNNNKVTRLAFSAPQLMLQESRHGVSIYDVIFNPINNVKAGQALFTTVRLENLGDNIESNLKVTVSVPTLGLQTSQFVDQLLSEQELVNNPSRDGRDATTTNDLVLLVPQDAREGDYDVIVNVNYNRGYSNVEKKYTMHVKALSVAQPQTPAGQTLNVLNVNVDTTSQKVSAGQGAVYKFSVSNMGQTSTSVNFEVNGGNFVSTRVDPSTLVIEPNSAKDAFVYVSTSESQVGLQTFSVKVTDVNGNVLADKTLSVDVSESKTVGNTTKNVLIVGFVVLLALLVILSIVVIVKKLSEDDEKPVEGQTYY